MDGLTMDGFTVDGITNEMISVGGFTIEAITVERILPPAPGHGTGQEHGTGRERGGYQGRGDGQSQRRDSDPVEIPVRGPDAGRAFWRTRPAGLELADFTFADLEPAGLGRLGLDLRRLELLAGFESDDEWMSGLDFSVSGTGGPDEVGPEVAPAALSVRPTAEGTGPAAVFDRAAHDYDADIHGIPFFRPLGRTLAAAAGIRPGDDVVDLACGRGAVLFPAAEAAGSTGSVRAFDLAPTMVDLTATDVAARALPWVDVAVADAMDPPVEQRGADVVLCGLGLFLLPDPAKALVRWRELLRPGGRLAVSVFGPPDPLWDRPDYPLRRAAGPGAAERRPGLEILAGSALAEALAAAGFTITRDDLVATDLVFRDVEHWWHWARGTAVRPLLEQVDSADLPAMIDDLTRWHAPSVDAGGLHWRPTMRIVTATVTDPRA